jgi:hypothetical protein
MKTTKRGLLLVAGLLLSATSAMAQTVLPERPATVETGDPAIKANRPADLREDNEIDLLKAQLAAQQEELNALRKAVEEQGKLLALVLKSNANSAAVAVSSPAPASDPNQLTGRPTASPEADGARQPPKPDPLSSQAIREEDKPSPLSFRIGTAHITPFGFIDLTAVIRDKDLGSGIGTNFGAVPFSNTVHGNLREFRFSAQNSRLGLRVDAKVRGLDLLGYLETDFLGLAPGNVAVTSNSDTQRLRLIWVDVRRKKLEFLAGQSWSLLTPNRAGLSPLPGDIFLGQSVDTNYLLGLTWSRNPQFRFVYHANDTITLGWSLEASEQYGGGANGSGRDHLACEPGLCLRTPVEYREQHFRSAQSASGQYREDCF